MVLFDSERADNILDCAQINLKKSITLKYLFLFQIIKLAYNTH